MGGIRLEDIEQAFNFKIEQYTGKNPNLKLLNCVNSNFMPVLAFYYRNNKIYELSLHRFERYRELDIENIILFDHLYTKPIIDIIIEKIEQMDKDLWYVFLAP